MSADKNRLSATQVFSDYLARTHRRRTPERFIILDCVMSMQGHFSIEELCRRLADDEFPVATATVYNTLELLTDCGLLLRHRFGNKSIYESSRAAVGHSHLICTQCGRIKEVKDPFVTNYFESKRYSAFTPSSFSITVFGTCSACARKFRAATKAAAKTTK